MLNTYACPHPLNRLRPSQSAQEYLVCQDCLGTFELETVCGHNVKGYPGEGSNGKTWVLIKAMGDKSRDVTPLAKFIPQGVTVDDCRPKGAWAPAPAPASAIVPAAPVDADTSLPMAYDEPEDQAWGRPGSKRAARLA